MVIVMDNNSVHVDERVRTAIEAEGHIILFLPPYSPDFNPIELTFAVLKAWIKRNHVFLRSAHPNYGDFLVFAIAESQCDHFVDRHFRHSAGGVYIEQKELDRVHSRLRAYERGEL